MLWYDYILIVGYSLLFCLIIFYKKIIGIFRKTDRHLIPVKYALISAGVVTAGFIIWVLWDISTPILESTSGIWLISLPPIATLVGIGVFLISYSVITLYVFFSPRHSSAIPKKELILQTLLSIIILTATLISTYTFASRQLLLREAKSPQTSQARLAEIYTNTIEKCSREKCDFRVLQRLAGNPQTPAQILEDIYISYGKHAHNPVARFLARNKNISAEILEELAQSPSWNVRISVAENPNVARDILLRLKSDKSEEVRKAAELAWNNKGFDRTDK